jgi:hypothetical protein
MPSTSRWAMVAPSASCFAPSAARSNSPSMASRGSEPEEEESARVGLSSLPGQEEAMPVPSRVAEACPSRAAIPRAVLGFA